MNEGEAHRAGGSEEETGEGSVESTGERATGEVRIDTPLSGNGLSTSLPGERGGAVSTFWREPPRNDDGAPAWHTPPLPARDTDESEANGLIERTLTLLRESGFPAHALSLDWDYRTGAVGARHELDDLVREIAPEMQALREERRRIDDDLLASRDMLSETLAGASIVCPSDEKITIGVVKEALNDAVPTQEEIAGGYGLEPIERDPHGFVHALLVLLLEFLSPLVVGFMVAMNLGTLVGLLRIEDVRQGRNGLSLVLAGLLGFVIVKLMGELFYNLISSIARSQEPAHRPDSALRIGPDDVPPRHRSRWLLSFLLAWVMLLIVSDVTVAGIGIRMLHQQSIRINFGSVEREMLPFAVYLILGALITGPYLFYKASRAWNECETRLRMAWVERKQWEWLHEKLESEPVKQALRAVYAIEQIQRRRADLERQMAELRTRLDAARIAAVGEADRFHRKRERTLEGVEESPEEEEGRGQDRQPWLDRVLSR